MPGTFNQNITGTSLAVDMGDHVLVVESGQSDARGMAVMVAAKQAIPNKSGHTASVLQQGEGTPGSTR